MIFQVKEAREQLLENGIVYTFRTKEHKEGKDWATDHRCGKKIADINVQYQARIHFAIELEPYWEESGFQNLEHWVRLIEEKYAAPLNGFLYRVSLLGGKK